MTRRAGGVGVAVATVVAGLCGPAGVFDVPPACAARPGEMHVAIVIDVGEAAASTSPPASAVCVGVRAGANGLDVLAARARDLGRPAPRFAPSGLLCAIDGVPATGCGDQTAHGYRYWSYWRGRSGHWEYANSGPASMAVASDIAEGWRFVDGRADGTDPSPRAAPDTTAICHANRVVSLQRRPPSHPARTQFPVGTVAGVGVIGVLAWQVQRVSRRRRDRAMGPP